MIRVTVEDVNDNSPAFYPTKHVLSLEDLETRTPIFLARAADPDAGDFGRVSYSWADPSEVPPFLALNGSSGEVEVRGGAGGRRRYETSVRIAATDGGGRRSKRSLELLLVRNIRRRERIQVGLAAHDF